MSRQNSASSVSSLSGIPKVALGSKRGSGPLSREASVDLTSNSRSRIPGSSLSREPSGEMKPATRTSDLGSMASEDIEQVS